MLQFVEGNLLDVSEGYVMHGCNAQGVMGSGVAKQLRDKYPRIYRDYVAGLETVRYNRGNPLGEVFVSYITPKLFVCNAITQEFYGRDAKQYVDYGAIDRATEYVVQLARRDQSPVFIPDLLGAGLGGGNRDIILDIFQRHSEKVVIYIVSKK